MVFSSYDSPKAMTDNPEVEHVPARLGADSVCLATVRQQQN
jgi:hypothetical protein